MFIFARLSGQSNDSIWSPMDHYSDRHNTVNSTSTLEWKDSSWGTEVKSPGHLERPREGPFSGQHGRDKVVMLSG